MVYTTKVGNIAVAATMYQRELAGRADAISLVFEDSIHKFYNRAFMDLKDVDASMKEAFVHANGALIGLTLARHSTTPEPRLACVGQFVVDASTYNVSLEKSNNAEQGMLHFDFVNSRIAQQKVHNRIHKGRISDIIKKLCKEDGFITDEEDKNQNAFIMECGNDDTWHQIGMTNAEFIQKVLVPNAYGALDLNPYFAWVDSNGNFYFQNLMLMTLNHHTAQGELHLKLASDVESGNQKGEVQLPKTNAVNNVTNPLVEIREWNKIPSQFSKQIKNLMRKYYNFDWMTGEVQELDDSFIEYPLNMAQKGFTHRPFGVPFAGDFVGSVDINHTRTVAGVKMKELAGPEFENHMGRRISSMWEELLCDRYECVTPFFPQMKAGKTVLVGTMWKMATDLKSPSHTGLFLIESSKHGWNMATQEPFSVLTLIRYGLDIDMTKLPNLPHLMLTAKTKVDSATASDANSKKKIGG